MPRAPIPKQLRDSVLSEYRHRCAICGSDRPHIHHIDENPENNEPFNLLPLCPNCHLTDLHDPTGTVDPEKLKLFRRYRDPLILRPQFHPIFKRQAYLSLVEESHDGIEKLIDLGLELIEFVEELTQGKFYAKRLTDLLKRDDVTSFWEINESDPEAIHRHRQSNLEYRRKLLTNREKVQELLVELLRFQNWNTGA